MMKLLFIMGVFICSSVAAESIKEIEAFKLDHRLVHTIYCHERNSGVTTVVFPAEISGIYAAKVAVKFDKKQPNPFLLSFTPGSAYFTIKSLSGNNASGAVNVVFESKVYVIHLKTVKKGHSSVTFVRPRQPKVLSAQVKKRLSPAHLISMLDKAKAYHLFKNHYPQQSELMGYHSSDTIMDYSTHQILLKEVIRFDDQDTLFFHIQIKNKSKQQLRYSPKDFAVNISNKIFYSALADASGVVPEKGVTTAWFCISGSRSGGRNNLDAKNDWKLLLNVSQMPLVSKKVEKNTPQKIKEEEKPPVIKTLQDIEIEEPVK